jgi:hypothetical protein
VATYSGDDSQAFTLSYSCGIGDRMVVSQAFFDASLRDQVIRRVAVREGVLAASTVESG